jgi:uncharacterized protein
MQLLNGRLVLSPSDLNDHVECEHLTTLKREVASGERKHPHVPDDATELLRRKGEQHEAAYLAELRTNGREVVDVRAADPWDFDTAARKTEQAMRDGADVIYQATFVHDGWRGRADFLERVDRETNLGAWGYEPLDTKLARAEKPTYVLQLCFYAEGIARVQGVPPERMHVLLGIGRKSTLRHDDFAAYYHRVRASFEAAVAGRRATEPYPVDHCGYCDFRSVCHEWWDQRDHLSLVASIRRDQTVRLAETGVSTLTALAGAPLDARVDLAPHTLGALREQAELQRIRRTTGDLKWRLIPPEPGRGFALLPRASAGDVVFDIEGNPFWEPARGLHFLLGLLTAEGYGAFWSHTREEERRAFEALIDFFTERLAQHPDMHVYHYGAYEKTAIAELMSVYATREAEVDALLRREVFVNLHTVVRQALRAGVPSYSLKEVEALAAFKRRAKVAAGTQAVIEYERWMDDRAPARLTAIRIYNEEDCRATLALRDWLLGQRPDDTPWLALPEPKEPEETTHEPLRRALTDGLTDGPRWLAGELLEYHRREARPAWWWFFARQQMTVDELVDDAGSIGRLSLTGRPRADKQSLLYTFTFPAQQHKLGPGDQVHDPATRQFAGTIEALDDETLVLRRGPKFRDAPLPEALIPGGPIRTTEQRNALVRLAESVLAGDGRYRALERVLARARPRFTGGARATIQTMELAEQRALAASLDGSYLFVQGPPGTGKTWTGARLVVDLMRRGRRVGVAATSHKAIHNLLAEIEKAAREERIEFRGLKKSSAGIAETEYKGAFITSTHDNAVVESSPASLVAGTAWLFAREAVEVDTLVIDEAGQVSLADALAMGTCARNLILLGDPLQLAQVSQGTHPPGTGVSVLEHLLDEHGTVPPDMGVFLDRTRRMHPDVCRFVSKVVYDDRLSGIPETARQSTAFGTGLRWLPVQHVGNQSESREEAARVVEEIRRMVGAPWTNQDGLVARLRAADFMVVAPYNAQVRRLRTALAAAGLGEVPVGTVDKFQGRQAPVVFYSMATSSAETVPRGLEFLFSRNRLNVAISRAQCLAHVVASPRLLESRARSIEQMRLINALCRFVESAESASRVDRLMAARLNPRP